MNGYTRCPHCRTQDTHRVLDVQTRNYGIYRRRQCNNCKKRFHTREETVKEKGVESCAATA